jgi:hypothetical protein
MKIMINWIIYMIMLITMCILTISLLPLLIVLGLFIPGKLLKLYKNLMRQLN